MALTKLPTNLPVPEDDGAANHLVGQTLPAVALPSTSGDTVNLADLVGDVVIYIYPMTGKPDVALPEGWEAIPGARGCTPQSCSFRDHYAELVGLGASVYGLSTQTTDDQREAKEHLGLPYDLLSDVDLVLEDALALPTFTAEGTERYKRLTLIAKDGDIVKVFYPVFPPDRNAADVVTWLQSRAA